MPAIDVYTRPGGLESPSRDLLNSQTSVGREFPAATVGGGLRRVTPKT